MHEVFFSACWRTNGTCSRKLLRSCLPACTNLCHTQRRITAGRMNGNWDYCVTPKSIGNGALPTTGTPSMPPNTTTPPSQQFSRQSAVEVLRARLKSDGGAGMYICTCPRNSSSSEDRCIGHFRNPLCAQTSHPDRSHSGMIRTTTVDTVVFGS